MKPAESQSRNLIELTKASHKLTDSQRQARYAVMIGALAQLVSPELWDQALNTTYGYIASCQVKLRSYQLGKSVWHAFDGNQDISNESILGIGATEQDAKDDFWRQWKEKRG